MIMKLVNKYLVLCSIILYVSNQFLVKISFPVISQVAQMLNNRNIEGDRLDYQMLFKKRRPDMREQGCCNSTSLSSQYDNEIFPYEIHFPTCQHKKIEIW